MKRLFTLAVSLGLCALSANAQIEREDYTAPEDSITTDDTMDDEDDVIEVDGTAFDLPEGMTLDVDQLLQEWHAQQYLSAEGETVTGEAVTLTPEEYRDRLSRIPAVMEMPYNDVVRQFIEKYTGRLRRSVSYMLGASNLYIPTFEAALDAQGLPLELRYLPVIESALKPTAVSHAGATGLWQMMLATGKRYDLEVNSLVDERRDPFKSTDAATRYLKDLYGIYSDWNLVLAAYNCGPTNVNKAIHRAGGEKDFWKIYPYLPAETRGYVPAFIAANYVMTYYCEHGITPMQTAYPMGTDTVMVSRDLSMEQVAALCNIDLDTVKALNPQYRTTIIPGSIKPYALCLPTEMLNTFIDLGDKVYEYRADELLTRRTSVEVEEGDAQRVQRSSSQRHHVGSNDYRHKSKSKSRSKKDRHKKRSSSKQTIRQGDTLSDIAKRNGTTVKRLQQLNGIKGSNIRAGKKIRVR